MDKRVGLSQNPIVYEKIPAGKLIYLPIVSNIQGTQIRNRHALLHAGPVILLDTEQDMHIRLCQQWVDLKATNWPNTLEGKEY